MSVVSKYMNSYFFTNSKEKPTQQVVIVSNDLSLL